MKHGTSLLTLYVPALLILLVETATQLLRLTHRNPMFLSAMAVCLPLNLFGLWRIYRTRPMS